MLPRERPCRRSRDLRSQPESSGDQRSSRQSFSHLSTVVLSRACEKSLPPAIYESEKLINDIAFYSDITQFRGTDDTTLIEVTILSPVEENLVEYVSRSSSEILNIEYQCMLRNAVFNPLAADKMIMEFPLQTANRENLPNATGILRVFVPPQQGDITLQLKDIRNDKIGYATHPLTIRNFSG